MASVTLIQVLIVYECFTEFAGCICCRDIIGRRDIRDTPPPRGDFEARSCSLGTSVIVNTTFQFVTFY